MHGFFSELRSAVRKPVLDPMGCMIPSGEKVNAFHHDALSRMSASLIRNCPCRDVDKDDILRHGERALDE